MNDPRQAGGPAALAAVPGAGPQGTEDARPSEAELLCRIAQGDQSAMAEFYRRHSQVVFAQILLVVGERPLSEEVLQDTMLAIWRGASSFRGESRVRTWVIAIARRKARDRMRGHRLRLVDHARMSGWASPGPGPEDVALERAEVAEVATAIRALTPAHREVLGLAFGAGLSLPEVAELLEIPLGTVKSRLIRARAALGRALNEKGTNR